MLDLRRWGISVSETEDRGDSSEASLAIGNAVRDLLTQQDPKFAVNPWLKSALGLGATAVWRKLTGEAKWTAEDLEAVASKMGISLGDLLRSLASRMDNSVKGMCEVDGRDHVIDLVLDEAAALRIGNVDYVAVERKGQWRVLGPGDVSPGESFRHIKHMSMTMKAGGRARVALLDDDPEITYQAATVLAKSGQIDSDRFDCSEDLIKELDANKQYDAYVFDWRLAEGTSESLIQAIRGREASRKTPIFVVTGAIEAEGDAIEDDLARVVRDFGCKTMLKPVRWKLLQAEISQGIRAS